MRDGALSYYFQCCLEAVTGERFPQGKAFEDALKDGIILCNLMNKLSPGSIAKINTSGPNFKMMENVNKYGKKVKKDPWNLWSLRSVFFSSDSTRPC